MDPSPFDDQIAQLTTDIERHRAAMRTVSQQFMTSIEKPTANWMRTQTEEVVNGDPNTIVALGPEGVKRLKADLEELVGTVPRLVTTHFNMGEVSPHKAVWPHQTGYSTPQHRSPEQLAQAFVCRKRDQQNVLGAEVLSEPFQRLQGELFPLLLKRGFKSGLHHFAADHFGTKYHGGFPYTPEMCEFLNTYAHHYQQFNLAIAALEKANADKSKFLANELWKNN